MRNWSIDEKYLKKYPEKYKIWRLVQLLSYGLDKEKLDKKEIIKHWPQFEKQLDPARAEFLKFLLWGNQS